MDWSRRWLIAAALALLLPGPAASADHHPLLELSYTDFDQRPGGGWRKLADDRQFLEAAELIDRYLREHTPLENWQRRNLRFHAGQLYAFARKNEMAIARFKAAINPQEPAGSPIRWNAYVRATIAFLERDRETLLKLREEISQGPPLDGSIPNLAVVDRLIEHYDQSYADAYGGRAQN